jgi:glutathione S-transferase
MDWIVLVSLLAILQLAWFSALVSRARGRYGVRAPAIGGHEVFERHHRVHANTVELLVMLLPTLWLAALYVRPLWPALLGTLYLIGRLWYARAYVADPARRGAGFVLSMVPIMALALIGLVGAIRHLVRG